MKYNYIKELPIKTNLTRRARRRTLGALGIIAMLTYTLVACTNGCDKKIYPPLSSPSPVETKDNVLQVPSEKDYNYYEAKLRNEWSTLKNSIKQRWDKFTDEDLLEIQGNIDNFIEKIKTKYNQNREKAEQEIKNFLDNR